ncbi:MAG: sel1 repeat family protein [Acidobacteriia bacterium]|nr:sel1 repeat family protein [Terriglobia bacterium]
MKSAFCLLLLAAAIAARADFATGLAAYQKGDYVTAMKEWMPLAEQGDAPTQFNVGLLYLDGHGVPQSPAEAVKWFTRSADQDYTEAQHNLGAMYGSGQGVKRDYVQAYKWLNICAAKGNAGCVNQRDLIAKKLKRGQLENAQRLSTEFKPKKESEKSEN